MLLLRARAVLGRRDIQICIGVSGVTLWEWIGMESNGVDHDFSGEGGCTHTHVCPHVFMYVCTYRVHAYISYLCLQKWFRNKNTPVDTLVSLQNAQTFAFYKNTPVETI